MIDLGVDLVTEEAYQVDPDILRDGGLVIGAPGSGKTTLGGVLLRGLIASGRPVIAFDTTGDLTQHIIDTQGLILGRGLAGVEDEGPIRVRSLGVETAAGIFLRPDRVDADQLRDLVAAFLSLIGFRPRHRAPEFLLVETLVYLRWQAGNDVPLEQLAALVVAPPILELGGFPIDRVISPGRRQHLADAIIGVLGSPAFGRHIDEDGVDLRGLLGSGEGAAATVLSFSTRSPGVRRFLVAALLAMLRTPVKSMRPVVYFDEASEFVPRNDKHTASVAVMDFLRTGDAYGTDVVMVAESLSVLHEDVEDLCETWFVGKMPVVRSRREVVEGLDLVNPPIDEIALDGRLASLSPGQFVVRSSRLPTLAEVQLNAPTQGA